MKRVDEIRARCEAATKGPWITYNDDYHEHQIWDIYALDNDLDPLAVLDGHCGQKENAVFISHAREDIPFLLDENERLNVLMEASEHFTLAVSKHLLGNGPEGAVRLIKQELDNFLELSGEAEKEADHGRGDAAGS